MSHPAKGDKPRPDQRRYLVVQFVSNLIGVVIVFLASDGQVRGDVRLGRLLEKPFRISKLGHVGVPLTAVGLISTTALVMAAVALIIQGILAVAVLDEFSVETATAFKTVSAMLGTLAGCGTGVWWDRRRESALMAGKPI